MCESKSHPKTSSSLNTTITLSDAIRQWRRMVRDYSLLCLDECMDEASQDYQNLLIQLQINTDNVNMFRQRDECIDFLTDTEETIKSFLILENTMAQHIMLLVNDIPQLHSVYIFSNIKSQHEEWTTKWPKIKSVHTNIDDLSKVLQLRIKKFNQDTIAMSFLTVDEMASTNDLNQLEPTFMYTQLFKETLLDMKHDEQAIKQFTTYCRYHNCGSAENIDKFDKKYQPQSAIWWYTYPSFIYSMLNYALRSMEGDIIINMGFFIHDLHQQIQQLHQQQVNSYHGKPFLVYRGQGLSKTNFEKLQTTKGGLMSFNNFLSTSTEQDTPLGFALSALENADMVGILFIMSIDPNIKTASFASIKEMSYFRYEDEILFSMHTIFRVGAIKQMNNEHQLYQVELELTSDDDQQLRLLTDWIREEVGGNTGWQRLGNLLLKIGQFNKAEELHNVLLEQPTDDSEKAIYYNQLGYVKDGQGDYEKAIWYYEQGLKIKEKTLSSNHPSLAISNGNIGTVYENMKEYSTALSYYEKALAIQKKTLPSNHPSMGTTYNNIGGVYDSMGEYSKALSFYDKALEIQQKILPSNHPDLAGLYNNIGLVYSKMGEYSKALSFYDKALEIQQKTLPSNHPDFAQPFNNIGSVYYKMGEYSTALSFYDKALEIQQKNLPSNHHLLATSYNNIGLVYHQMGEYSKALSFCEKALEIQQKNLPSNHHLLAISYNNTGNVYSNMEEYSKALPYLERALDILQRALPAAHPHIKMVKEGIEVVKKKL